MNFQMFKLDSEKPEEPEIKLPTSAGSPKKRESSIKTSISALLPMPKPLTVEKVLKKMEIPDHLPASWEICMQVNKQQLELDMEQQTGSKGIRQAYILSSCSLNLYTEYIMWNAGLKKHKLESRLPGEISITSDTQMIPSLCRKRRRTKEPLDESERGVWKSWLKAQHSEN